MSAPGSVELDEVVAGLDVLGEGPLAEDVEAVVNLGHFRFEHSLLQSHNPC